MNYIDDDVGASQVDSATGRSEPVKRFRLGRYVLMLLFAFMAVAYVTPAVTSLAIAIDSAGQSEVNLKRMTEGGSPVDGPMVGYGTFFLITVVSVGLVVAAALAAVLFLSDRTRPTAWTVLTVVGVLGVGGAIVALTLGTGEIRLYLASMAACYATLVGAGLFELWRARWVLRQPVAPAPAAPGTAEPAPAEPPPV
jgi:hypothetical protein